MQGTLIFIVFKTGFVLALRPPGAPRSRVTGLCVAHACSLRLPAPGALTPRLARSSAMEFLLE
jgi:hypothetical protein